MKFGLIENGLDSLKMGLHFYNQYLSKFTNETGTEDFEKDSYLKLAVICIQNSAEILVKKVLSDTNDLLIYKDIDGFVAEFRGKDPSIAFHDYLIEKDSFIQTIGYKLCIERLEKLFNREIHSGHIKALHDIGLERNKLTHFGISKELDYHKTIGLVHRVLQFIEEFILNKIAHESIDSIRNEVVKMCSLGKVMEQTEWSKSTSTKFQELEVAFTNCCEKLQREMDIQFIYNEFTYYLDIGNISIESKILPHLDSLAFLITNNESNKILAIIDISKSIEHIYVCKKSRLSHVSFDPNINSKVWKDEKSNFERRNFVDHEFEGIIKGFSEISLEEVQ